MPISRALGPFTDPRTYRRWAYLVVGGALLSPYLLLAMVTGPVLVPGLATAADVAAVAAVTLGVLAATSLLPPVAALEVAASRELLGVALPEGVPGRSWSSRRRTGAWFVVHVLVGGVVGAASLLVPASAIALIVGDMGDPDPAAPAVLRWASSSGGAHLLAALGGVAAVVVLVAAVAGIGALLVRAAPRVLGPTSAERLAALEARAGRLAERDRLARELHDSVGHALSVVTLQAGAAGRVLDHDPAFARDALDAIEGAARDALRDLDHALGLLREDAPGTVRPTPTLEDVSRLVDAATRGGATIDVVVEGAVTAVPAVASREAYRIVQEGVTNAVRHADGAPVAIRVAATDGHLDLVVANPLTPTSATRRGGGRGLRGVEERVEVLGGTMTAGAEDGRWQLRVRLPLGGRR